MAKRELNNKLKRKITFALNSYLESRFNVSCDLLNESLKDNKVNLDYYVAELKKANKILADLENDDARSKEKREYEESIRISRARLVDEVSQRVVPTSENIKEILELVTYFIDNYPLPTSDSFNETLFLRYIMKKLSHDRWIEVREKAYKYFIYFNINVNTCFRENVSGRISFGYGSIILINNQDYREVFKVDDNKRVVVPYSIFSDYIIFSDTIFLAHIENRLVPLRQVDGYYYDFLNHGVLYQNRDPKRKDYIEIYKSLNEYLKESGLLKYDKKILALKEIEIITEMINGNDEYENVDSNREKIMQ